MISIDYKLLLLSHVMIIEDLGILYARRSRALTYLMDVEKQSSDVRLLDLIVQYPVLVEPYNRSPLAIAISLWYDISSMSSCKVQKTEFKSFCLVKLLLMSLSKSSLLFFFLFFSLQLSLSSLFSPRSVQSKKYIY
jgi:hypothetical protein